MLENPTTSLHRVTLTIVDELYNAIKDAAAAKHVSTESLLIEYIRAGLGLGVTPRIAVEILRAVLIEELKLYAVDALNGKAYLTQSDDKSVFAVVDVAHLGNKRFANAGLIVRIVNDFVIIEHDMNDKPLVDALVQAGIPHAQIILAYAGEPIPETA
jgi:hypothetical protein